MDDKRDEKLWQLARHRARFQNSLISFVVISVICWGIWYLTAGRHDINRDTPWPLWVMLGLGIGLAFRFMKAYKTDSETMTEREYEKLKNQQK